MPSNCSVEEDSWESLGQEIKPVGPKRNQSWIFIGRTDAEAEAPILWPRDAKSQHIGKDPDAGKDRRQEKGMSEGDEMVGWRHGLHGPEFEQVPGDGEDRGACHASVHGVAKCRIQLSNWTITNCYKTILTQTQWLKAMHPSQFLWARSQGWLRQSPKVCN